MKTVLLLLLAPMAAFASLPLMKETSATEQDEPLQDLQQVFKESGIHLDLERKLCSIDASVAVRDELLEYLLVSSHGAAHESLFVTSTNPSVLNTAMIALGVQPGQNATWGPKEPAPTEDELKRGVSPYDVVPPTGDGFYIYAAWKTADETYFYRIEDLLRNLSTGRSMQRHRWVYLGSRMVEWETPGEFKFAAEMLGNLINIAYFEQGDTMVTGAIPECVEQSIWVGNSWLLPERSGSVKLIFSVDRLGSLPSSVFEPESGGDR